MIFALKITAFLLALLFAAIIITSCAPPFWPEQSACKSEPVKGACK